MGLDCVGIVLPYAAGRIIVLDLPLLTSHMKHVETVLGEMLQSSAATVGALKVSQLEWILRKPWIMYGTALKRRLSM